MSKVNQHRPTIRAQHQIHDLREIKWLSPKQRCSNIPMIPPSWQTGPSLCQETAMIDFALVWLCGRRQTESLPVCVVQGKTTKYHLSWKLRFANGLSWIWFWDFRLSCVTSFEHRAALLCLTVFPKQAMRLYAPFHKADILICHRLTVYHQSISYDFWRNLQKVMKFMLISPTSDVQERE